MNKKQFIKSFIVLIGISFITKLLAMVIRIITARALGSEGLGIYMLTNPTLVLCINLAQMGIPVAVSKMVADHHYSNRKTLLTAFLTAIITNVILIVIFVLSIPYLANNLLHNSNTIYPLYGIALLIPFVAISGILKGYLYGKQNVTPTATSLISEQIVRIIFTIILISYFIKFGVAAATFGAMLAVVLGEIGAIIHLLVSIKFTYRFKKNDIANLVTTKEFLFKDMLSISVPTTGSRLISSLSYFVEPIIITFTLLSLGFNQQFITDNYGIINGYVMPLLMMPTFVTVAATNLLLPTMTDAYSSGNLEKAKKLFTFCSTLCLSIGLFFSLVLYFFPNQALQFIYNTTEGSEYVKLLSLPFLVYYIQPLLTSCLQAINKNKQAFTDTLIASIIKVFLLYYLTTTKGIYGMLIATLISVFITTGLHLYHVFKHFIFKKF